MRSPDASSPNTAEAPPPINQGSMAPKKVNSQEAAMQSRQEPHGEKAVQDVQDIEKSERAVNTAAADAEQEYPSFWKLVLLTIALCMAMLVVSLDGTILATAIPRITNEFNSLDDVAWYGSSYLFAVCALQLMFGKFYIMYPVKWVFLAGVIFFEIGSLIASVSPSVICLLLALQWGGAKYPWDNGRIIALFVVFGVLGVIFWGVEIYQKDRATVPLRILKNKNILGGVWYGVCMGGALFVFSYYLPIWFQAIKGVDATNSGLMNMPSILGLVIFSIIGGGLATALGMFTPLLIASSAITAVGAGLLSTLQVDSTIGYWFGYQVVLAAGAGLGAQNVMLFAQVAVPMEDMAMATSIMTFTQTLSSSIFLAVAQNVFQNQLIKNLIANAPNLNSSTIVNGGVTAIRDLVPPDQLPAALQAYNDAVTETFYVAVAVSALSIFGTLFIDWISLKQPEKKSTEESQDGSCGDRKSAGPETRESENEVKDGS